MPESRPSSPPESSSSRTGVSGAAETPRFAPRAAREMARMFDHVSLRYDLLNRLMTLGRDGAWRAAMWRAVPEDAGAVLDLCTGNGVSLTGLRRPGRLLMGMDVSAEMLRQAREHHAGAGWAPRFVAADAFRLPLAGGSLDAITVAFGVRNLRPAGDALAEMARVLREGGTLAVLEASTPRAGWFAPLHALHVRYVIPLAGRLSPDPSAYEYLSRSIFEFGLPDAFERELENAGFDIVHRQAFMLGAARLWVGRRLAAGGQGSSAESRELTASRGANAPPSAAAGLGSATPPLQSAGEPRPRRSEMPQRASPRDTEWRWWTLSQLVISAALLTALIAAVVVLRAELPNLALPLWERRGWVTLVLAGVAVFAARTAFLLIRFLGPPPA